MRVERCPEHRRTAFPAGAGGVSTAVPEARLVTDEDLVGADGVPVRAPRRRVGDPFPGRGLYQVPEHPTSVWRSSAIS